MCFILWFASLISEYTFPVYRKKIARACFLLSSVFSKGGKQTSFCLGLLRERWFFGIFSTFVVQNSFKLQYVFTIHNTILPSKFLSKQSLSSEDIGQKLTFPKETQAKRSLFTSQNFLTQRWSAPFSRSFSQNFLKRDWCIAYDV